MAARHELAIAADDLGEPAPHLARAPRQRQLGQVAALLAHAAIIDAARLAAARPALEQNDRGAAPAQMQRRRAAGGAAADDRDIRSRRARCTWRCAPPSERCTRCDWHGGAHVHGHRDGLDRRLAAQPADALGRQIQRRGQHDGGGRPANASLAAPHAAAAESLGAVDLVGVERARRPTKLARGHALAAAKDGLVGHPGGNVGRKGEGRLERDAEPGDLPQRSLERRHTRLVDRHGRDPRGGRAPPARRRARRRRRRQCRPRRLPGRRRGRACGR